MKNENIILLISIFVAISTILITYIFLYFDKLNCDMMGGSYRIENNGIIQSSICEITNQSVHISRECSMNGIIVNCSELN